MINQDTFKGASFSFKNRAGRVVWSFVALVFFRFSPKPFHGWRSFLLRIFGAKIGKGVHVYPAVKIWAPWNLDIADECGIADGVTLYSQGKITIGKRSVLSQGVNVCTGTHNYNNPGFPLVTKPIYIGEYAWIATEAFIHPGITIGNGCIVGARSVVVKDMPEWTICSGFPCKPIKPRAPIDTNKV